MHIDFLINAYREVGFLNPSKLVQLVQLGSGQRFLAYRVSCKQVVIRLLGYFFQ